MFCILSLSAQSEDKLKVYTVNYPLAYFAERIAGHQAEVVFPAPRDRDPAFWSPSIAVIGEYQQADLILLNGADYAQWLNKVSLPRSRIVNTSRGFADRYIATTSVTHSHGPGGEHTHAGIASTTWLDFSQAVKQSRAIVDAIIRRRPNLQDELENNFEQLKKDLLALDDALRSLLKEKPAPAIIASHPRYQYLARRYELDIRSMQWEAGQTPNEKEMKKLKNILSEKPAQLMLWEDPPTAESITAINRLGLESVIFDPCANRPEQGDFLSIMRENIDRFSRIRNEN